MTRIVLTDGRWFDQDKAEKFQGRTYWDGRNHCDLHTRDQRSGENLYRTAGRKWILESWSRYQGTPDTFDEIDDEAAAAWLVRNGDGPHEACAEVFAALEVK